jgi:cysteine desulfurase family protein
MIYFDNAATTFPKPSAVTEEVRRCMNLYGGNPGRSGHTLSVSAAKKVFECRELAAEFLGVGDSERIFFTPNTTYGINAVLKGLLKEGDHVLISDLEHNAVWRPIHRMAMEGRISYDIFRTFAEEGEISAERICSEIGRLLRPETRMVFCTHGSNICSAVLPIDKIGDFCSRVRVLFCVDGAQTAGHEKIDVDSMKIDALCLPGHKGLYGPQGSGLVALGRDVVLDTFVEGGNGVDSLSPLMPEEIPERYEAGTVSTPCIAGLWAGLRAVKERGIDSISSGEKQIISKLRDSLGSIRKVDVYVPWYDGSILLFNVQGLNSETVATQLDRRGICVRGGYHCAGLAHRTLGTPEGGAVRVSVGMFNKPSEADTFVREILSIVRKK